MIPGLDTGELVHVAMMRGVISRISMSQCAHTWGPDAVEAHNHASELRGDLKTTMDVLWQYAGDFAWTKAQAAVAKIDWLTAELELSKANERAALATAAQDRREVERCRLLLARAATVMRCNDPGNARDIFGPDIMTEPTMEGFTDVEEARQASGPEGAV